MPRPISTLPVNVTADDSGVAGEHGADLRAAPQDKVQHSVGKPRAIEDVDEFPRARRHEVGRLEDDRVAEGERRRDLPRGDRDREVPRRDDADDADRLAGHRDLDTRTDGVQRLAVRLQRDTREVLEDLPGAHHLAPSLGKGLALLAREQVAQLVRPRHDLRCRRGRAPRPAATASCGTMRRTRSPQRATASPATSAPAMLAVATTSDRSDGLTSGRSSEPGTAVPPTTEASTRAGRWLIGTPRCR